MAIPQHLNDHPIFNGSPWGAMSGEAPRFPAEEQPTHENLVNHLRQRGVKFEETHGRYGDPERSVLIYNPTRELMSELGKKFGQESVVYSNGGKHELLYTNGEHEGKSRLTSPGNEPITWHDEAPDDYYSHLPNHGYFTVNFDFDRDPEFQGPAQVCPECRTATNGDFCHQCGARQWSGPAPTFKSEALARSPIMRLKKAWPKDETENQANAATQAVMEDAILEQGGKKIKLPGRHPNVGQVSSATAGTTWGTPEAGSGWNRCRYCGTDFEMHDPRSTLCPDCDTHFDVEGVDATDVANAVHKEPAVSWGRAFDTGHPAAVAADKSYWHDIGTVTDRAARFTEAFPGLGTAANAAQIPTKTEMQSAYQRSPIFNKKLKKANPPHELNQVLADQLQEQGFRPTPSGRYNGVIPFHLAGHIPPALLTQREDAHNERSREALNERYPGRDFALMPVTEAAMQVADDMGHATMSRDPQDPNYSSWGYHNLPGHLEADRLGNELSREVGLPHPHAYEWHDGHTDHHATAPNPTLVKGWPKDETENQANAASHAVMEDAWLEQGAKKTVHRGSVKALRDRASQIGADGNASFRTVTVRRNNYFTARDDDGREGHTTMMPANYWPVPETQGGGYDHATWKPDALSTPKESDQTYWQNIDKESDPQKLDKMAIADLRPSERPAKNEQGQNVFNYSHLLSPDQQNAGYRMHLVHEKRSGTHELTAEIYHNHDFVGDLSGYSMMPMRRGEVPELDVITSSIADSAHHNKGLGRALYEALYAHAYHHLGARRVNGDRHSSMAHRVHVSLAKKHGLEYVGRERATTRPRGPFDGRFGSYSYALKSELVKNAQVAPAGVPTYSQFAGAYGTLQQGRSDLMHYPYHGKSSEVADLVKRHGYRTYFAGGKYGKPDLQVKNYDTGHLMIYDPTPQSGSDFHDHQYTSAWRQIHELAHALTHKEVNSIYGEGRRMGKLGTHRSMNEAMRAVHWEWLAAHKQRELSTQVGIHIPDEVFHKELNTVMHDAVHRAVTGKFTEPSDEGFVPHSHKVPLHIALDTVRQHAEGMGLKEPHAKLQKSEEEPPKAPETWTQPKKKKLDLNTLFNIRERAIKKLPANDNIETVDIQKSELPKANLHSHAESFLNALKGIPKGSPERGKFITQHMSHPPFIAALKAHPQGVQIHKMLMSFLNSTANAGLGVPTKVMAKARPPQEVNQVLADQLQEQGFKPTKGYATKQGLGTRLNAVKIDHPPELPARGEQETLAAWENRRVDRIGRGAPGEIDEILSTRYGISDVDGRGPGWSTRAPGLLEPAQWHATQYNPRNPDARQKDQKYWQQVSEGYPKHLGPDPEPAATAAQIPTKTETQNAWYRSPIFKRKGQ